MLVSHVQLLQFCFFFAYLPDNSWGCLAPYNNLWFVSIIIIIIKILFFMVPVQGYDIGRFWTYLLPRTHQIYIYLWNYFLWKMPPNKLSYPWILGKWGKKKTHISLVGKDETQFHHKSHQWHSHLLSGRNAQTWASTQGGKDLNPTSGTSVFKSLTWEGSPKHIPLKDNGACSHEIHKVIGNYKTVPKVLASTHSLTSEPSTETDDWKASILSVKKPYLLIVSIGLKVSHLLNTHLGAYWNILPGWRKLAGTIFVLSSSLSLVHWYL